MSHSLPSRRTFLRTALASATLAGVAPGTAWGAWRGQDAPAIEKITVLRVPGAFYRPIAMNAYDDAPKGKTGTIRLVRAILEDGTVGLGVEGYDRIDEETVATLQDRMIGTNPLEVYAWDGDRIRGVAPDYQDLLRDVKYAWFESALLDLVGRLKEMPVYALFGDPVRPRVDAYDGTLYFKDVELDRGPDVIGELASRIQADGYQAIKMKVGRGSKCMEPQPGLERDIEAVVAAREAVGSNFNLMADANNGYGGDLERGLQFLRAVNPHDLYWMEELLPEDEKVYAEIRRTMYREGLDIRMAEGENAIWSDSAPIQEAEDIVPWVENGHFDVVQPDLRTVGFTNTLRMADVAAQHGVSLVPHNWQSDLGKRMGVHLGMVRENVRFVEDDRWSNYALDTSAYLFRDGQWVAPEASGWGVRLSEHYERFAEVEEEQVIM